MTDHSDERNMAVELAAMLRLVLDTLHPLHGNTAHHGGGYGGSMIVQCCHMSKYVASPTEQMLAEQIQHDAAVLTRELGPDVREAMERMVAEAEEAWADGRE